MADIVCGEAQSIGVPMSFGGPHLGFFACREKFIRQMPGRLCGETVDAAGKKGYVLTLSTREQHIRREKATSNICTNQGLCALAFTVHMALLGEDGFKTLARLNHETACDLADALERVPGVSVENKSFFNEFVITLPKDAKEVVDTLAQRGIIAGYPVDGKRLLVTATEMTTENDMKNLRHRQRPLSAGLVHDEAQSALNEKMARCRASATCIRCSRSRRAGRAGADGPLAHWLKTLTGMPRGRPVAGAGAHGELCGMMADPGRPRGPGERAPQRVLVPESAHGTNPATAAALGYAVESIPANARGRVDLAALKAKLGPDVGGDHADQPQHLRPVRERDRRDRQGRARGGRLLLLRRRQLQRHRRRVRPAISASTACTSTCTRPSRRRMAAAVRGRARWCCRRRWRPTRRCPGSCMVTTASVWSSRKTAPTVDGSPSAA
jgi:hypothetical protein